MFSLKDRVALITGGGRGLGAACAVAMAEAGADVAVASRTPGELEAVAAEVRARGRRALVVEMDMQNLDSIRSAVARVEGHFGRIDILVNNAGVNRPQPNLEVTEENWDLIMDTNVKGLFFCTQAVGRGMLERRYGRIVMMSSQAGIVSLPGRAAYCASKAAVNSLTRVLGVDWAPMGVTVNAVCPTYIETPLTAPYFAQPGFKDWVLANLPAGRVGVPQDVVGAVLFLSSDAAALITGVSLPVDGGWTAR